jgi:hypothetical protein
MEIAGSEWRSLVSAPSDSNSLFAGIPNLDAGRFGSPLRGRAYLVEDLPGTGIATLATQPYMEGEQQDERCR